MVRATVSAWHAVAGAVGEVVSCELVRTRARLQSSYILCKPTIYMEPVCPVPLPAGRKLR